MVVCCRMLDSTKLIGGSFFEKTVRVFNDLAESAGRRSSRHLNRPSAAWGKPSPRCTEVPGPLTSPLKSPPSARLQSSPVSWEHPVPRAPEMGQEQRQENALKLKAPGSDWSCHDCAMYSLHI